MKTCSVPNCGNDSFKRPELSYFSLPRPASIREEWMEILGVKNTHPSYLSVCELHFRAKDFRTGKKELKVHSVPVLRLGKGQADAVGSDDEFYAYGTDSDTEVVELSKSPMNTKNEKEAIEINKIKEEPKPEVECEVGRRPSRRAAIVAAKKISNTVRNYNVKDDPDFDCNASTLQKPAPKTEKAQRRRKSATPALPPPPPPEPIDISLDMECDEEMLSETQAETLANAQNHYNLVMKGLRELVAYNVKVMKPGPFGTAILNPSKPFQTIPVKNSVISTSLPSQTNKVLIRTDSPSTGVPVAITLANCQSSLIIM